MAERTIRSTWRRRQANRIPDVGLSLIGNALPPASLLLIAPILARALGVQGRGEIALATATLALAIAMASFGLPEALTYFYAKHGRPRGPFRQALIVSVLSGSAFSLTVLLLTPFIAADNVTAQELLRLASIAIVPALLSTLLRARAAGLRRWRHVLLDRSITALFRIFAIYALFFADLLTPLSATLTLAASYFVGSLAYIAKRTPALDGPTIATATTLGFSTTVWAGSLTGILLARIDQVLLSPLSSPFELGIYAVAINVSEVVLIVNLAIREITFSKQTQSFNSAELTRAARVSTILVAMAGLPLAIGSPFGVPLIFGDDFAAAVPVIWIALIAIVLGNPGSIAGAGLTAAGHPGLRSVSLAIACTVNIFLVVALCPQFGALGAAVATLIGNVISSNLNIFFARRTLGIPMLNFYPLRLESLSKSSHETGRAQGAPKP